MLQALLTVLAFTAIVGTGCSETHSPQDVAGLFWDGVAARDVDAIRRYSNVAVSERADIINDLLPVASVSYGRVNINDTTATIATSVTVAADDPVPISLQTILILENEVWKVDYGRTVHAISERGDLAEVLDEIRRFGEAISIGVTEGVEKLEQVLPVIEQELGRIEQELKIRLPELRRRLEEFARKLENALNNAPREDHEPPADPEATIEI